MKLSHIKRLTIAALCSALCVVLPMAFHVIPNAGSVMLPMHIPVLLCGIMCGWPFGLICGVLGPILSSLATGMPPAAMVPAMALECAAYGCVGGLMMRFVRTKSTVADLYISLLTAMLIGRVIYGFAKSWIFSPGTAPFAWVTTSLIAGIPGIAIQLVLIPILVLALMRAKLLPYRYQKEQAQ